MNYIAKGTSFSSVIILKNENGSDSSRSSKGAVKLENAHKHTTLDYEDLLDDLSSHSSQKDTDRRLITQLILENQDSKNGKIVYEERFSVLEKKSQEYGCGKDFIRNKSQEYGFGNQEYGCGKDFIRKKSQEYGFGKDFIRNKSREYGFGKDFIRNKS